jgi:hypothetical protein
MAVPVPDPGKDGPKQIRKQPASPRGPNNFLTKTEIYDSLNSDDLNLKNSCAAIPSRFGAKNPLSRTLRTGNAVKSLKTNDSEH